MFGIFIRYLKNFAIKSRHEKIAQKSLVREISQINPTFRKSLCWFWGCAPQYNILQSSTKNSNLFLKYLVKFSWLLEYFISKFPKFSRNLRNFADKPDFSPIPILVLRLCTSVKYTPVLYKNFVLIFEIFG